MSFLTPSKREDPDTYGQEHCEFEEAHPELNLEQSRGAAGQDKQDKINFDSAWLVFPEK
jgi:hypothetical protein